MRNSARSLGLISACVLLSVTMCAAVRGNNASDRTQFGRSISVAPGEEVSEATCFGCSIRVRGHVAGDVTAFGGSIVVEDQGQVDGDATAFAGSMRLDDSVKVGGDVTVFGGQIHRAPGATLSGGVTVMGGPGWAVVIFAIPLLFLGLLIAFIFWLVQRVTRPRVPVTA